MFFTPLSLTTDNVLNENHPHRSSYSIIKSVKGYYNNSELENLPTRVILMFTTERILNDGSSNLRSERMKLLKSGKGKSHSSVVSLSLKPYWHHQVTLLIFLIYSCLYILSMKTRYVSKTSNTFVFHTMKCQKGIEII